MNNTHGEALHSPITNGSATNDLVYRQKPEDLTGSTSSSKSYGNYQPPRGEVGWICPVCGRSLAPSTSYCPCNLTRNITYIDAGPTIQEILDSSVKTKVTSPEAYYTTTATEIKSASNNKGTYYGVHD